MTVIIIKFHHYAACTDCHEDSKSVTEFDNAIITVMVSIANLFLIISYLLSFNFRLLCFRNAFYSCLCMFSYTVTLFLLISHWLFHKVDFLKHILYNKNRHIILSIYP